MTYDRIFNMEGKRFDHKNKKRKIIAVTGSKNVWSKSVEASFHMTIVACVAANVLSIPPLFIIPGQQLNRTIMDQFSITGVTARYPL